MLLLFASPHHPTNSHENNIRCTPVLLRLLYAGARYTTSFSDNFKSRISTQLLETKHPLGPSGKVSISVILGTTCLMQSWQEENGVREGKILLGDIAEWEGVRKREALIPLEEKTRASQERL